MGAVLPVPSLVARVDQLECEKQATVRTRIRIPVFIRGTGGGRLQWRCILAA